MKLLLAINLVFFSVLVTPSWSWDEPTPISQTKNQCKQYLEEGYDFFDSWIVKYDDARQEICPREKPEREQEYNLVLGCHSHLITKEFGFKKIYTFKIGKTSCMDEMDKVYKLESNELEYRCVRLNQDYEFRKGNPDCKTSKVNEEEIDDKTTSGDEYLFEGLDVIDFKCPEDKAITRLKKNEFVVNRFSGELHKKEGYRANINWTKRDTFGEVSFSKINRGETLILICDKLNQKF